MKLRAYRSDLLRTLRSPSVIVVLVVITILGIVTVSVITVSVAGQLGVSFGYSEDAAGYHIVAYVWNAAGAGEAGAQVVLTANPQNFSGLAISLNTTSDSQGFARFSFAAVAGLAYYVNLMVSLRGVTTYAYGTVMPIGPGVSGMGGNNLVTVSHGLLPTTVEVQAMLVGSNGGPPSGLEVLWGLTPGYYGGPSGPPPGVTLARLGTPSAIVSTYSVPLPAGVNSSAGVYLEVVDANGTILTSYSAPVSAFSSGTGGLGAGLYELLTISVAIFVPLLGVFAAYGSYARDRLTGVLDNVLVRPVTRGGIALARYAAISVAMLIGLAVMIGAIQAALYVVLGEGFGLTALLPLYLGFAVEALAFAGILFIIAHLLRSPGTVLVTGITLFFLLTIVWLILVYLLLIFTGPFPPYATGLSQLLTAISLLNPAQFPTLVTATVLNTPYNGPASVVLGVGINPVYTGLVGAAWVFLPLAGFYLLARYRD